jgi:hypothetical protein
MRQPKTLFRHSSMRLFIFPRGIAGVRCRFERMRCEVTAPNVGARNNLPAPSRSSQSAAHAVHGQSSSLPAMKWIGRNPSLANIMACSEAEELERFSNSALLSLR